MARDLMPALPLSTTRWFELVQLTAAAGFAALVTAAFPRPDPAAYGGPDLAIAVSVVLGTVIIVSGAMALLSRWARRRGHPLVSDHDWFKAKERALRPVPVNLMRRLMLMLVIAQMSAGRPVWSFTVSAWKVTAAGTLAFVLAGVVFRQIDIRDWSGMGPVFPRERR